MFWFLVFCAVLLALGATGASLRTSAITVGATLVAYLIFGSSLGVFLLLALLAGAFFALAMSPALRREHFSRRAMEYMRDVLPEVSDTEAAALESGTVWWDGELFSGAPNWARLQAIPPPRLNAEEQAFLDGPVNKLCAMFDDWAITHRDFDISSAAWKFIKDNGFWGLIIPKRYGGMEFSASAHSAILSRVAGSPGGGTASSIVSLPNSLGPAELLLQYGTEAQKDHYLPRLAKGEEIPCFALTSPWAGSDAAGIPDTGVVCKGTHDGREVVGIRLNFDKRYITMAPVATLVGLAFRLYDPDGHLGEGEDVGITCALVPHDTPGVEIGKRHLPLTQPFMNGPVRGRDVFIPLGQIIGGPEMAGKGWRMLMECLSVGRSISLPSSACGGACLAAVTTSAYARVRHQFGLPVGEFEGVQAALARVGGGAFAADAVRRFTAHAVDLGERPSVPSAIAKYHVTEVAQDVVKHAMDVHGGKGIMLGPNNWLASGFQSTPIAITVEGANILTRSLIVFGQGALRCHPFLRAEIEALGRPDPEQALGAFDQALWGHLAHGWRAAARSVVLGLSGGRLSGAPGDDANRRHYQHVDRYSANLALLSEFAFATLGGRLKFSEHLSARLGDVLRHGYVASAVLKRHEDLGRPADQQGLVDWACEEAFHGAQAALDGVLRNLPNRPAAWLARLLVFPIGRHARPPGDATATAVVEALRRRDGAVARLAEAAWAPEDPDTLTGRLWDTVRQLEETAALDRRLAKAIRDGKIRALHPRARIDEAAEQGLLDADEARRMRQVFGHVEALCAVDEFEPGELSRKSAPTRRKKAARKSVAGADG